MTQRISYSVMILFSVMMAPGVTAQSLGGKPGQIEPKQLYIEKYLSAHPTLPGRIEKAGSNESFDFYRLPLDKMICAAPGNGFKAHIKVFDPTIGADYPSVNIPNAISKGELIK